MNQSFKNYIDRIPCLFKLLITSEKVIINGANLTNIPAIYVFYKDDKAVQVGRTRKLKNRIRGHVSSNHYSASFAFKSARLETGIIATYKKGEGRDALIKNEEFSSVFQSHVENIRNMKIQYLKLSDPVEQYLLELYSAIELETSLSEFDTH